MILTPSADRPDFFAVNVFRVLPEHQEELVDCIRSAGDPTTIPGLLSMHLLRSADGTQVVNHMHWASKDAFDRATKELGAARLAIRRFTDGPQPHDVVRLVPADV